MKFTVALLLSAYLGAGPATAESGPPSPQPGGTGDQRPLTLDVDDISAAFTRDYVTCMNTGDARDQVTYALINCKQDEFSRQDDKLNRLYKALISKAQDKAERETLTTMEKKWIKGRDAICDSEVEDAGDGTMAGIVEIDCMLRYTTKRVIDLQRLKSAED